MARFGSIVVFLVVIATLQYVSAQTSHIVGDGLGWNVPPAQNTYVTWAAGKTFVVGDTLVFNFATGRHDVVQVPRVSFDDCSDDNPIGNIITTGPATVTLTTPGEVYFLCNVANHCESGQKLAITVSPATTAPSPPTTPGSPPTTAPGSPPVNPRTPSPPPPPPSSSTAVFASGFLTFLAVVVGFFH